MDCKLGQAGSNALPRTDKQGNVQCFTSDTDKEVSNALPRTDKEVSNALPWTDNGVLNETENGMGYLGQTRKCPTLYLGQKLGC